MKYLNKIELVITLCFFMMPVAFFAQDRVLQSTEIPSEIHTYVKKHFPKHTITRAEVDTEMMKKEYEIELNDGTDLEFDSKFQIKKIDSRTALPASVVPVALMQYAKKHYPNNTITGWETERKQQKIELNNDVELIFNTKGKFIRIDD
ncbi:MAG: PepSY-like domain-containing protein [Capnocytophaga sp.]|nr:PepSY-like domain-containing protein [Capnocytophaga sp.]